MSESTGSIPNSTGTGATHAPQSRFFKALARAVQRLDASEQPSESEIEELIASVLHSGVSSDALWGQMLMKIPIGYFPLGRHPAAEGWDFGLPRPRVYLIRLLRRRALGSDDPPTARTSAQAAVRLAMFEGFQLGPAQLHGLLSNPTLAALTGWPAGDIERLLVWADGEQKLTGRLLAAAVEAAKPLDRLVAGAGWNSNDADLFASAIKVMARVSPRADVQWQIIHFVWKMLNLARNRGADEVVARMRTQLDELEPTWPQAHARRWISVARREPLEPRYCWSGIAIGDPMQFWPAPD